MLTRNRAAAAAGAGVVLCTALALGPANASGIKLREPQQAAPIYQYKPPATLPSKLPTPKNAVGQYFAIQSLSASQDVPTSAKPSPPNCTGVGYLNKYQYTWPNKAQSIQWWKTQPGIPAKGTYAYQVGSQISHQDAEGWVLSGGCKHAPQPSCRSGAGWSGDYTWTGQWTGWQAHCVYTPQPSCPAGVGWTGSYAWNGSTKTWIDECRYLTKPPCPASAGWTGGYYWTGTKWASGCVYHPRPSCPTSAGWAGSYSWNGSSWVDGCHRQPRPHCPSGDTGSYSWNGSAWVNNCKAPASPPPVTITYFQYTIVGAGSAFGSGGIKTGPFRDPTPHCHPFHGTPTVGQYIAKADAVFCSLN